MESMRVRPTDYLKDRELGYLLSPVRVVVKAKLPKDVLAHIPVEEVVEGRSIEIPRWLAEMLVEDGCAEAEEEDFGVELFRALSRERIQGPQQLSTLRGDFYLKLRGHLGSMNARSQASPNHAKEYEKHRARAHDLLSMRTGKLLSLAGLPSFHHDVLEKMTEEEKGLFSFLRRLVEDWRKAILSGGP